MFDFMDLSQLMVYLVSMIIIQLTPGANVMFICAQSLKSGQTHSIFAALGISTGVLFYVFITAFGMAEVFKASPSFFKLLKLVGGAYLLFLAYKSFKTNPETFFLEETRPSKSLFKTYFQGLLTMLLNPKAGLFFFMFLPQFINIKSVTPLSHQILYLGLFAIVGETVITLGYAFLFTKLRGYLTQNKRFQRNLNKITGSIFGALALKFLSANVP